MAAALADHLGQLLLGIAKALGEIVVTRRLLDSVEVGTLHVFDQRDFEQLLVTQLTDDRRHLMDSGALRGAPAPVAGDNLVAAAAAIGPDNDRLQQTLGANRVGQFCQLLLAKVSARVQWAAVKLIDANGALFAFGRQPWLTGWHLPDQGRKAAAKSAFLQGYGHRSSPSLKGVGHGCPRSKGVAWSAWPPSRSSCPQALLALDNLGCEADISLAARTFI